MSSFREAWPTWCSVPQEVRDRWWMFFKERCTWDPRDDVQMRKNWHEKGGKHLSDMLGEVRVSMEQPQWIGDAAWKGLVAYWFTDEYAKKSAQAKANQASDKGGALHTTRPIPHIEVVENLALDLNRTIDPDEMVYVTRRRKDGSWVDDRSKETYTAYQEKIKEISSQGSTDETQSIEVDKLTKLRTWSEVVGGKKHGRVFGTAGFSSTFSRAGASTAFYTSQDASYGACNLSAEQLQKEMDDMREKQAEQSRLQEEKIKK
ncbi:unnamed protein product [Cuscuta campestris]|uniref:Uncharacterized protein n=1 Tax=Cuscuta campestris TaxID=132261 RepID=A0A484KS19_9ASTE|nr:unnamed protein product [Cuscuta campestris]